MLVRNDELVANVAKCHYSNLFFKLLSDDESESKVKADFQLPSRDIPGLSSVKLTFKPN